MEISDRFSLVLSLSASKSDAWRRRSEEMISSSSLLLDRGRRDLLDFCDSVHTIRNKTNGQRIGNMNLRCCFIASCQHTGLVLRSKRYGSRFGAFFNQRKSFAFDVHTKEPKTLTELVVSILIDGAGEARRLNPPVKLPSQSAGEAFVSIRR